MNHPRSFAIWAILATGSAAAQQGAQDYKFATPESDASNYLGDRISYDFSIEASKARLGKSGVSAEPACVASRTSLKGVGKVTAGNGDPQLVFRVSANPPADAHDCDTGQKQVSVGDLVLIDPQVLQGMPPNRFGFTYGTLLVPYKYQFKGDKSLSGGAAIGGYLGYREAFSGYSSRFILFGGITKIDVPTVTDDKVGVESVAGLSYGLGWLGTVKDSFQLGVVIGADRVSKSVGYVNNGKPWLAVSLGFGFSN
jgi:hypothetical protein